jgi:hypothetical protein
MAILNISPKANRRLLAAIITIAVFTLALTITAFMQEAAKPATSERVQPELISQGGLAPDAITVATYPFTNSSAVALEDMSSGTTQLVAANQEDTASSVNNIGFDFWFDGVRQTQFSVNANGLMKLGSIAIGTASANDLTSPTNIPQIAPYWDDLYIGTNGKVHFKVFGSAPNRKLVVEWQNMQIPRLVSPFNNLGAGTFQCWLYETTGVIEFVYGSGVAVNSANSGYSIGFGSSGTVFASVASSGPTVAYGTANNNNTNAITSGTKYTFTPLVPSDPTGLNFTATTQTSMTLNWTDNSSNELGFVIYRSDDGGSTYSFVSQTSAGVTSSVQSSLVPGTTYFWKVFAVTEGAFSANPAAGSNATNPPGNITSTGAGGNWSSPATWVGGVVPTATDDVTIADGATVTIDVTTAACLNLIVGQGTSGILEYISTPASSLAVNSNVTVAAGGTFTAGSGSLTTHTLSIGGTSNSLATGSLIVEGTFDLNTTAGVTTTFFGRSNGTVSGIGPTCDFFAIVTNKGSGTAALLDVARVITTNAPTAPTPPTGASRLTITNGTFKLSSASTITPYAGNQIICAAGGRLWINNASASVTSNNVGTASDAGAPTINGTIQVDAGTFGYGSGNNTMIVNGTMIIGGAGATVNMFGVVNFAATSTFTMTAGNFNVDCQAGNSTAFTIQDTFVFITGSTVNFIGGTLTLIDPHPTNTDSGKADFRVEGTSTNRNFAGSTIRFGDGASTTSGNASTGGFQLSAPSNLTLGTVVINNPSGTNRNTRINSSVSIICNLNALVVTAGTFSLNGNTLTATGDLTNNGVINGDSTNAVLSFVGGSQQTLSGAGGFTNSRIRSLTVNNSSGNTPAVNLNQSFAVTTALNLTSGSLGGGGTLTLGDSAGSTVLTTTRSGGSLANTPTFNLPGVTYNVTYTAPSPAGSTTTGSELPSSISGTLTINNSNGVLLNSPLAVNTGLALTNGLLTTTATSLLTLGSTISGPTGSAASYVNGPLAIDIPTTGGISRTYAIGKGAFFRPLTLSSLGLAAQSTVTAEVVNSASGGTPVAPLATLDPVRYWQLSNSAALNGTARIRLAYDTDDNVFDTVPARVAQSSAANGSYSSIGGSVTGTTVAGTIISTLNLTPGSDFFTIASESPLPTAWDGGAATSNWGDAANWTNDTVPDSTTDVSLSFGSPTTINVNGTFSVKNLTIGTNTTLNLGSGSLNVTGNYIESSGTLNINTGNFNVTGSSTLNGGSTNVNSGTYLSTGSFGLGGGTLANGTGTLNCKSDFTLTTGSFTVTSGTAGGTTIFSGTAIQNIAGFAGGTSLNNVTLQGGGAGVPKRFTANRVITAANDFIVATSAQISLTSATATVFNVGGNLNYGGLTGGSNIGSLTLNLTGTGKTINGTALSAPQLDRTVTDYGDDKAKVVNLLTDASKIKGLPKDRTKLENTYARRRDEVNALIAKKDRDTRLIINLDDATIVSNPSPVDILAPTPSAFEMNLTIASGANYALLDNVSIATGKTLSVTGRLNADTFTIGGAGNVTVTGSSVVVGNGTLGTATSSASGLGATLINTGLNTFTDAIIEYNASGAQTINATTHPAAAMIYTAGSGTKTLNGNKALTGDSGGDLSKGALFVGSGTTFADGGFTLSLTSLLGFDNVVVNGTYSSSGAGAISYESGPTSSGIFAVDGTQFGNLLMNFDLSNEVITLNTSGIANISFRDLTFGGAAGLGSAGGTLLLNETGTTNVIVNGNVNISPPTTTNNGGGFGGNASTVGTVTVKGNIITTSTATTQPIFNNTGTNTLIMGHPSTLQTLTLGANATIFTGSTLRIDNPAGMQLGATPRTITLGSGGTMLVSAGASFLTGNNTFINSGTTTVNGSFVISAGGVGSGGAGTYNYHATTGTLVFNTTAASAIDNTRTYWPTTNGPQNVSVVSVTGTAGLTMNVARTVGILFQTTAVVAGTSSLTCNGTCRINAGGSFTTAPTYGSSSLLQYNTSGTSLRGAEWSATSGAGFPNDVQVSNSTTFDLGAGTGGTTTARAIARNLTIDAGSTLTTNVGGNRMTATLTVPGNLLLNGSLILSSMNGGDLIVGGNWTNNSTFTNNGRTVTFNGASAQTVTGATSFTGLTLANTAGGIDASAASTNLTVTGLLTMTQNTDLKLVNLATDTTNMLIMSSGSTATTAGTGQGEVVGTVRRASFSSGTSYSFGSPFVQLGTFTFTGAPTQIDVTLTQGSPDTFANSVRRNYQINVTGGTITSTILRLHYRDDATTLNGNAEGSLDLWRGSAPWTDVGATTRDAANNWVEKTAVNTFSPWTLANTGNAPTAVRLTKFNAVSYVDGVQLSWESGFEVDNLGYHLYRERQGKRTRVTPAVVAGSALTVGPGSRLTAGYSYSWFDHKGTADTSYYLEAIDLNGARQWAGPIYPNSNGSSNSSPKRQQALLLSDLADSARASGTNDESAWPAAMKPEARRETLNLTASGLAVQQSIASGEAIKIQVNRTGWHRLNQPELAAAGFDPTSDARLLQLYIDGTEVPIQLSNNGPHLESNDTLEFYGVGLDTPTTDTRTYWLITGNSAGKRIPVRHGKPKEDYQNWTDTPTGSFAYTTEKREKLVYLSHLLNGEADNIFGAPIFSEPVQQTLTVNNFDGQSNLPVQIEVALQGLTEQAHQVQVQFNGSDVGTVTFSGVEHPVATFNVNRGLLHAGNNEVSLVSANGDLDISFIDSIRLTYAHQYRADNNAIAFSVSGGQAVRVGGFTTSNVRLIDVTNPSAPLEVATNAASSQGGYAVVVPALGNEARTLIAFTDDLSRHPAAVVANNPSNWNASTNGADLVIITHKNFLQAIQPLATLRRNQGLSVAVVDVEDVYDEFSYGDHTPVALKSFLSQAALSWSRKPAYLLLVGDSTWDPRNYLDQGFNDFVPTKLIDTGYMETGSDDWFADFNSAGLSSMAIGRLPARTAAEVNLMVGKILTYEQERELNAPLRGAVMVSDNGFENQSSQTAALLPSGIDVQTINRSQVGNDDLMRGQIVNALNQGPMIVNYYGHGSVGVWTGEALLDVDSVNGLTNTNRLSLYLMMTCLNGYSHDVYVDSLGESALKAPTGGAVAVWASSGFTEAQPQFAMDKELYLQLFGSQPLRLGEAMRNAKGAISDPDVRRTWMLLGDPTMRMR